jgi:hypothetical protein
MSRDPAAPAAPDMLDDDYADFVVKAGDITKKMKEHFAKMSKDDIVQWFKATAEMSWDDIVQWFQAAAEVSKDDIEQWLKASLESHRESPAEEEPEAV